MEKFKFLPKSKINQLPKRPGVYLFKKDARLLYVGKAVNLKARVKNHQKLLGLAEQLAYVETKSEIDALILEARLIKKLQPKYNVQWRDDKNYFYIGISQETFPRIFITHQCSENSSRYIGPFVNGRTLKQALTELRKYSPFRTCKTLPRKPCLWYHLARCPAPCLLKSRRIEAYDVSNIQGKEATGSMVTFINGRPDKNLYRRFKIKTVGQPNDTAMLKEVLQRRLKHKEWGLPDLILIDGGKAQLNTALSTTKIPVAALAKRKNELYLKGLKKPVLLNNMPREIFNAILQLRDEAHRFAHKYHSRLRTKSLLD